jgi:pantothenate kinase-related protein Tda10|tara:strand:+ start:103 stop:288 length:186 start_codon:yes stop_codon:yes gene_type:complete
MNRPLMFINNTVIVEQLKQRVWDDYKNVRNCDFEGWYIGLSPIEKTAWEVKFDEIQENERR